MHLYLYIYLTTLDDLHVRLPFIHSSILLYKHDTFRLQEVSNSVCMLYIVYTVQHKLNSCMHSCWGFLCFVAVSCIHPWEQGSRGQHGTHLGPTGPRWAPCWPHGLNIWDVLSIAFWIISLTLGNHSIATVLFSNTVQYGKYAKLLLQMAKRLDV